MDGAWFKAWFVFCFVVGMVFNCLLLYLMILAIQYLRAHM